MKFTISDISFVKVTAPRSFPVHRE